MMLHNRLDANKHGSREGSIVFLILLRFLCGYSYVLASRLYHAIKSFQGVFNYFLNITKVFIWL